MVFFHVWKLYTCLETLKHLLTPESSFRTLKHMWQLFLYHLLFDFLFPSFFMNETHYWCLTRGIFPFDFWHLIKYRCVSGKSVTRASVFFFNKSPSDVLVFLFSSCQPVTECVQHAGWMGRIFVFSSNSDMMTQQRIVKLKRFFFLSHVGLGRWGNDYLIFLLRPSHTDLHSFAFLSFQPATISPCGGRVNFSQDS